MKCRNNRAEGVSRSEAKSLIRDDTGGIGFNEDSEDLKLRLMQLKGKAALLSFA